MYHKCDIYILGFKQIHVQAHFFIAERAAEVFTTQYFLLSCFRVVFLFGFLFSGLVFFPFLLTRQILFYLLPSRNSVITIIFIILIVVQIYEKHLSKILAGLQ